MSLLRLLAGSATVALAVVSPASADFNDKKPISFSVDGATATGYFKTVAEAINALLRDEYPGSDATYKPGSPIGGMLNIATGKSDIVYSAGAVETVYALEGRPPFTEPLKGKMGFMVMLHNANTIHSFATKEWADKHGIRTYQDFLSKKPPVRIGVNMRATVQTYIGGPVAIFKQYGIAEEEIEKWGGSYFRSNINTNLEAFRDGKIDMIINGTFVLTALIIDIARSRDLIWLSSDETHMRKAADEWGNDYHVMPKDAYPFMTKDEPTVTMWSSALAGMHVPAEVVYKWLKAVDKNLDRMRAIHPSLRTFDTGKPGMRNPKNVELHPGAARFYREKGLL